MSTELHIAVVLDLGQLGEGACVDIAAPALEEQWDALFEFGPRVEEVVIGGSAHPRF